MFLHSDEAAMELDHRDFGLLLKLIPLRATASSVSQPSVPISTPTTQPPPPNGRPSSPPGPAPGSP